MKPLKVLATHGEWTLRQRDNVFMVQRAGRVVSTSKQDGHERDLVRMGLARVSTSAPRILIGGLGFGLLLRAVAEAAPPGDRGFELWAIAPGAKPQSLGVIPADGRLALGRLPLALGAGTVLAVSIEPKTGSPTGQPTGPVVATGDLKNI